MSRRRRLDRDLRRERIARLAEKRARMRAAIVNKSAGYYDGGVLYSPADMDVIAVDVNPSDLKIGGDD